MNFLMKTVPGRMVGTLRHRGGRCWCGARLLVGRRAVYAGHASERLRTATPGFSFNILATDISTAVLDKAVRGIYAAAAVEPVPLALRKRYLLRSKDRASDEGTGCPRDCGGMIDFRRLNFMDSDYGLAQRADVIFCRNALIYFDRPTQEAILAKLTRYLQPHGYLVRRTQRVPARYEPCRCRPAGPAVYRRLGSGCLKTELTQIHVQPGESHLMREPGILCTLLGSCVGITFWVRAPGHGSALPPHAPPSAPRAWRFMTAGAGDRRFVDFTIRDLAGQLRRPWRYPRKETEVKVFGGADVLDVRSQPCAGPRLES